ncbi:MAG: hypothetical protein NVSMB10_15640 [Steroidobacteraceae bacterium]
MAELCHAKPAPSQASANVAMRLYVRATVCQITARGIVPIRHKQAYPFRMSEPEPIRDDSKPEQATAYLFELEVPRR